MKPEADDILRLSAQRLATAVMPLLSDFFAIGQVGMVSGMMNLVAREYERGADIRAKENSDIRGVFSRLAPQVRDTELKGKIEKASRTEDTSLLISELNASNYALRRLLSEMLTHIEQQQGTNARQAEKQIWSVLKRLADRRLVKFGL